MHLGDARATDTASPPDLGPALSSGKPQIKESRSRDHA